MTQKRRTFGRARLGSGPMFDPEEERAAFWRRLPFAATPAGRCRSRAGIWREEHAWDRDGRCLFCDYLNPLLQA